MNLPDPEKFKKYFHWLICQAELPNSDYNEKKVLLQRIILKAGPYYQARKGASFETYITACYRHALEKKGGRFPSYEEIRKNLEAIV